MLTQERQPQLRTPIDVIRESLPTDPGVATTMLQEGRRQRIEGQESLAVYQATESPYTQSLEAIVAAGDEMFGIVKTTVQDKKEPVFFITRLAHDGEHPVEPISVIREAKYVNVGRNDGNGFSPTTSRDHFEVERRFDRINIQDHKSKNGTEVFTAQKVREMPTKTHQESRFSFKSLKGVLSSRKKAQTGPVQPDWRDSAVWALDEAALGIIVPEELHPAYIERIKAKVMASDQAEVTVDITSNDKEMERDNELKYARRYQSDSGVVAEQMVKQGIMLSSSLRANLLGEGNFGDVDTNGFARTSREVGEVINGRKELASLFEGGVVPDAGLVRSLADSELVGEIGRQFIELLADTIDPVKTVPEGTIVLTARESENAYKTARYTSAGAIAKLCSNTEKHFIDNMSGLAQIKVNGETVAVKKHSGDHTSLLVRPAILNGVRLPVGSVVITEGNVDEGYKFAFGRLTAFNLEDRYDAMRNFSSIFDAEYRIHRRGTDIRNIHYAYERFAELAGRPKPAEDTWTLTYWYQENQNLRTHLEATESLLSTIDERLATGTTARIYQAVQAIQQASRNAAELVVKARAQSEHRDTNYILDQASPVADMRVQLYERYGATAVKEVEDLIITRNEMIQIAKGELKRLEHTD